MNEALAKHKIKKILQTPNFWTAVHVLSKSYILALCILVHKFQMYGHFKYVNLQKC